MSTHVARRRVAAATALAVASSLVVGGLVGAGSAVAADRTASTSVDNTYLQDTLGLPGDTIVETTTYDRFQWLLQQPGQFAFVVGSPSADFKTKIQAVDTEAKAKGVTKIYWFDPNLSGYTGLRNLDTRNPAGITSIGAASQTIYGNTWKNVLAQYIGNGYKANGVGSGTITTAADDTVVNDAVDPLWDYRTTPAATPVGNSDNVLFVYDKDNASGGQADKVLGGVNLTTDASAAASAATLFTTVPGATIDQIEQFKWWQAENNRRLAAQGAPAIFGEAVLKDEDAANGWNVKQLTYPELIHLLDVKDSASKNFALLFGGTWCPNTRAVIKNVNDEAVANGVQVYNFDTVLDGGVVGGGTTSTNNPIQIRNNAVYSSGGVTTHNYVPSYLFGDLVRTYLKNIVTEYEPNSGTHVQYYPGGDVTAAPTVVRRLQVPYLFNYQRGTGTNPSSTSVKRQWIQQNTDASTGLPTFREYMSQFWFTNPEGARLGLSNTTFPTSLPFPENADLAPNTAFLTDTEQATLTASAQTSLVNSRRSSVRAALSNRAFGLEAVAAIKTFFAGLPGAIISSPTVTAPTAKFGTAPIVNLAIGNAYGRVPTGAATLTINGQTYVQNVAQNAASYTLPILAPGDYPFTVSYVGDAQIQGFSKDGTLTVTEDKTDSSVSASGASVKFGSAGTVKVSVGWVGGVAPTGNVTLAGIGAGQTKPLSAGTAVFNVGGTVAIGAHTGTVTYAGDSNYFGSAASVTYTVTKATPSLSLKAATVKYGLDGSVTVTANGVAGHVPTGSVTLTGVGANQTKALSGGKATFTIAKNVAVKQYTVKAAYAGDGQHVAGTATSTYTVTKATPSLSLKAATVKYGLGGSVTVTASGVAGHVPTGSVTVSGVGASQTKALSGGKATFTFPKNVAVKKYTVKATYAGNGQYVAGSATSTYTVAKHAVLSVKYATTVKPTTKKTGKATIVVAKQPGGNNATGKLVVTLKRGKTIKTVATTLVNSKGTVTLPKLPKGTWTVVAAYAGDANYTARSSSAATLTITS